MAKIVALSMLAIALLCAMTVNPPEDKVVFLDVGQGDAMLLQDGAQQVLIDGGKGTIVLERLAEQMPAFDRRIDVIVVTHPQQDHMEGLLHVMKRYDVGLVLLPRAAAEMELQEAWLSLIQATNTPYRFAWAGQTLRVGDMKVAILGPLDTPQARNITKADLNNASTIVRADFNGLSFLFTGDAEIQAEQLLTQSVDQNLLDVDILKAGHHGSNSSTHVPLIRAATPSAAVVSVGADNRYGHPHPNVLQRLSSIPLWRTDEDGSVGFYNHGDDWFVKTSK